jgi:hypothetical protein
VRLESLASSSASAHIIPASSLSPLLFLFLALTFLLLALTFHSTGPLLPRLSAPQHDGLEPPDVLQQPPVLLGGKLGLVLILVNPNQRCLSSPSSPSSSFPSSPAGRVALPLALLGQLSFLVDPAGEREGAAGSFHAAPEGLQVWQRRRPPGPYPGAAGGPGLPLRADKVQPGQLPASFLLGPVTLLLLPLQLPGVRLAREQVLFWVEVALSFHGAGQVEREGAVVHAAAQVGPPLTAVGAPEREGITGGMRWVRGGS